MPSVVLIIIYMSSLSTAQYSESLLTTYNNLNKKMVHGPDGGADPELEAAAVSVPSFGLVMK